jgi:antitoxin component YwqK of YwqJK toxin-antitoxin module
MRFSVLLLFLVALLGVPSTASAQEITKKRGKYRIYFPSGKLQSQGKVKNYHRNGTWKYYDEEGHVISIANFVLDTIHGPYTEFYPDGKISSKGTYCRNRKCGNWKMYDPAGALIADENYAAGEQEGLQRYWYPGGRLRDSILFERGLVRLRHSWYASGNLKTIETFENGLPEGRWTVYPEARVDTFAQTVDDYHLGKRHGWHYQWNGASLIEAYHYANGLPDGTFTRYEYNGNPLLIQQYSAGKRHGATTYYKDGAVVSEENYRDDLKHGLQTEYSRSGKPAQRSWYHDGMLDSTHSLFPNGRIAIRKVYAHGEVHAAYTEWDSAGVKLISGSLVNGLREGEWTTYYPDGKIRSTTNYGNGKIEGLYTKFYPNGKKMIQYTFLPVGTNTPPDVWNEKGKLLRPGTKQYDEIVEGNRPGEVFSDPSQFHRSIIDMRVDPEETE